MRYTILFVVVLILVSGFIAYFGDLLGRKMGKKRLTLFNMRPRHTAIIATTITGMLISALALFTLISVNSQFKEVLTHGEEILDQNRTLSAANTSLEARNSKLISRGEGLEQTLKERQDEVDAALEDVDNARKALGEAEAAVGRLEGEIGVKKRDLDTVHTDLAKAGKDLSEAVRRLSEAKDKLEAVLTATGKFQLQSALVRQVGFVLNQGDEIVRGTISGQLSKPDLESYLYKLLEEASDRAAGINCRVGENGRAVTVVHYVYIPEKKQAILIDDEPELVKNAIETISSATMHVVVQVVAALNTLPQDHAPVELKLYLNRLVYHEGDKVAETVIIDEMVDGHSSEGRILLSLTDFWKKQVSASAIKSGIIPVPGPDQRTNVGLRPEERLDELFRTLDRINAIDGPANVAVYATADIYAADLLHAGNVRFSVTRIE